MLQVSLALGAIMSAQRELATTAPVPSTQSTTRVRVPPPQAALHADQLPGRHATLGQAPGEQACIVGGIGIPAQSAAETGPVSLVHATVRTCEPTPHGTEQVDHADGAQR